jgi:hypothetical protein
MKISGQRIHLFLYLTLIIIFSSCNDGRRGNKDNDGNSGNGTAEIVFNEYEHDFGKIIAGEKVANIFTFENQGTGPLIISSAITSCGCTVSKYNKKPIPPGGKGSLEVVFDSSGRNGKQSKTISVRSNASKQVVLLKISCEIITE